MRSRIRLGLAVAVTAVFCWVGAAQGATILASPELFTYEPGPYVQAQGDTSIFDNSLATSYHDVTTDQRGPDGEALFISEMIPGGQVSPDPAAQVTPVNGTQYLAAGTYPFYCTLHGQTMSGELVVSGAGKPVPRPAVKVSFAKQTLKQARRGRIKVKLKASSVSQGVSVSVNKGKSRLGAKQGINLKAGQTRSLVIPLSVQGRRAISKGRAVKLQLRTAVAFGKPAKATKKLK